MSIIRNMVKQEGLGSFFKGLTPKVSGFEGVLTVDPGGWAKACLLLHSGSEFDSILWQIR